MTAPSTATTNSPMTAPSRFPFSPYPSGWFAVARSHELEPLAVRPVHYFGQELVLYRTEDGVAHLADAFCPHLGAHLGHGGCVVGQSLRCPFHAWRFDAATGSCVEVPFASKIPPRARLKTHPVREIDGILLAYWDVTGAEPTWELPSVHTGEWTDAVHFEWKLRTCCQEVLENSIDSAHLPAVHQASRPASYTPLATEGPRLHHKLGIQWDGAYIGAPGTELDVELEVSCHGVGIIYVDTFVAAMGMRARQRLFLTQIDADHIHLRAALHIQKLATPELTATIERMWSDAFQQDFVKDFPIWENKAYLAQPLLSEADGPIALLRRWARQFYAPGTTTTAAATAIPGARGSLPVVLTQQSA